MRGALLLVLFLAGGADLSSLLERAAAPDPPPDLAKRAVAAARKLEPSEVVDALVDAPAGARPVAIAVTRDLFVRGKSDAFAEPLKKNLKALAPLVASTGRPEAVPLLLPFLKSELPHVRLIAIDALGSLQGFANRIVPELERRFPKAREKEAKAILWAVVRLKCALSCSWLTNEALNDLPRLATVFDPWYRTDVLNLLVHHLPKSHRALVWFTGKDFGIDDDKWRRHIGSMYPKSAPRPGGVPEPKNLPPKDEKQFFGLTLPTGDLVFLIDASASMKEKMGDRPLIDLVKARVIEHIEGLGPGRKFNVIFFHGSADSYRKRKVYATKSEVKLAKRWIGRIKASGGTNLEAGLRKALADETVTEIVLLSDGIPTRGEVRRARDVKRLLGKRKVRIHTVAGKASAGLLKEIAKVTGGRRGLL